MQELADLEKPSSICPRCHEFALDPSNIDMVPKMHICSSYVLQHHENPCRSDHLCDTCFSNHIKHKCQHDNTFMPEKIISLYSKWRRGMLSVGVSHASTAYFKDVFLLSYLARKCS